YLVNVNSEWYKYFLVVTRSNGFTGSSPHHYFFFQAEDGIRDRNVTGVQTCALPIFAARAPFPCSKRSLVRPRKSLCCAQFPRLVVVTTTVASPPATSAVATSVVTA